MRYKNKNRFKNRLALIRKRRSIVRKEVASLLGHKTTDQISRYERGITVPNLKTALKLAVIYDIPIRILLDGYYEACRKEIKRQEQSGGGDKAPKYQIRSENSDGSEFCTIEQKLSRRYVEKRDLDKAYTHTAKLVRTRAEKLNHI